MLKSIFTGKAAQFIALMLLWLAAYKLATLLDIFRPYSSLWFLPAGITLSIFLAVPGWLKPAPFAANLLLVFPQFSQFIIEDNGGALAQALHAVRHCGVYGLAALGLLRLSGGTWPVPSLKAILAFVIVTVAAAAIAALLGVSLHVLARNMDWDTGWSIVIQWAIGDAVAALVLPPILVPLLQASFNVGKTAWEWPGKSAWLMQAGFVALALIVGSQAALLNPGLGSLWYLALIPPIFAGVTGGFASAAISVFLTSLATPLAAFLMPYGGEMLALSLVLTIGAIAALLVGAAVSDQRQALAAVVGQSRKLEEIVAERTDALADAYEFQRHLVRSLGHDLRQPLHTIALLLEGMAARRRFDAGTLAQTRQISATMAEFLDGILNYARHDPGLVTPNLAVFAVSRLFARLKATFGPIAESHGISLVIEAGDALLVSDETLLVQALSNDLDNAIRLSQSGMAVTLRHERRDGRDTFLVVDQIDALAPRPDGAAGFGHDIVARICSILDAIRVEERNARGMILKTALPDDTPKVSVDTPNS